MGMIQSIGKDIDDATVDYLQNVFDAVASPVQDVMTSIGLVTLLFIALNHIFQVQSIHYSRYVNWGVTYILVVSFATVWSNFTPIYNALTGITQGYSNLVVEAVALDIETLRADILDPSKITGADPEVKTYAAMDEFGHAIVWIAHDFLRDTSILDLGKTFRNIFSGVLILIVGGIFIAAAAVIVLIAKVGMILALSMAPLGIMMFMWEKTRHYFQGWVSLLVGFAVIPLLLGCLMAIVLYFASHILATSGASSLDKSKFWAFIFVMIAALVLLFHIPTMAQTLASASVAVGGASLARGMTSAASRMGGVSSLKQYMMALPQRTLGQVADPRKYLHAAGATIGAAKSGASLKQGLASGFSAFRRHADDRKAFWRNRREQAVVGPGQMSPNPAYQSYRGPSTGQSSSTSGETSSQMSPEQRDLYNK
ncbi:type IV secretion system protein [Rhizobium sp. BT-226]|uniref:type IV secretion system protein n=1 Tax=Rhizobium sp. BT-226 TaxID=2986922 RepID=UPI0021F77510|nr:type IV secretion system protein [Rhizobium sp. BT-226]MCW0021358.1 type IV secretion system protein [Rhizobium sp. BT-226]